MTKQQAYALVQQRVKELETALMQMRAVYDPETVGLAEWAEHNADCLYDLNAELFEDAE